MSVSHAGWSDDFQACCAKAFLREPRQSFMVVGGYPVSDGINGQLYLFGHFFRDKAAIIQNGDGFLPEAFNPIPNPCAMGAV